MFSVFFCVFLQDSARKREQREHPSKEIAMVAFMCFLCFLYVLFLQDSVLYFGFSSSCVHGTNARFCCKMGYVAYRRFFGCLLREVVTQI